MLHHEPVLLDETITHLRVGNDKRYIDCTLGDGGHSVEILKRGGKVLGIDVNKDSLKRAKERIKSENLGENITLVQGNFKHIDNFAFANGFDQVDGILYDLGYSSTQLKDNLGLSFQKDTPLDMRLDPTLGVTAADLLHALSEKELERLFREYSDERYSKKFARAIVERRSLKKFQTTKDLVDLIVDVAPPGYENGRIHPATRVFQALRIAVNDEFGNLEYSLPRAARLLLPGGRMLVITFHSLEEKLVIEFGRRVQPLITPLSKDPIVPSHEEVIRNVRARSAKLWIFEKHGK